MEEAPTTEDREFIVRRIQRDLAAVQKLDAIPIQPGGTVDLASYIVAILPKPRKAIVGDTTRKKRLRMVEHIVGAICNPEGSTEEEKEVNELWTMQALARRNPARFKGIAETELGMTDPKTKLQLTALETWECCSAANIAPSQLQAVGHYIFRSKGRNPICPEKKCAAVKLECLHPTHAETVNMLLKEDDVNLTAVHFVVLADLETAMKDWIKDLHHRGHFVLALAS
jgi:hypothetical protein